MPVVSSLANLPKDGEFYSNNCVDGRCIGCGMEHDCSVHGCAVINKAADLLRGDVK